MTYLQESYSTLSLCHEENEKCLCHSRGSGNLDEEGKEAHNFSCGTNEAKSCCGTVLMVCFIPIRSDKSRHFHAEEFVSKSVFVIASDPKGVRQSLYFQ